MKNYIVIILLLISQVGIGQSIKGKITSKNGDAIPFANIFLKNTKLGTNSTEDGSYELNYKLKGKYTLVVSSIGFKTLTYNLVLESNNRIKNIVLEDDNSLDEIVISGTLRPVSKSASPVPVEVYSKTFFKKNPTPSVFESLQNVNGIRPQLNCNVCNTGDIHINGLEGPYTFVLIDGMPIVSGLSTVYGLTGIPQALIERVEVVKGPASTLYGSEAVGGIINIITKKPTNAPKLSTDVFASSWGEVNTDIGLRYQISEKVQGLLGVNYFNFQNRVDNNNDNFTDLTLQNRISIFNKINIERKSNKVFTIAGRYVYEDRWGGELDWERKFRGSNLVYGESIYTNRWETFGTYQLPTTENIKFQFSANGHYQDSFYGTDSYDATQLIAFGQLVYDTKINEKQDLLLGLAYRYTYYDDNTFATLDETGNFNQPSKIHLPGIFAQDEISITDRKKLLLGLRWDYNSVHGSILSPRINYKWNSRDKSNIFRISVGNGFRVANVFTEDHAALTGAREVEFQGNLDPETSWNANINYVKKINTENSFITLDASAFYTYFNNRILPDYETDPNKIIYANLEGFSISKGVSLNADILFTNGLAINAGVTLMDVSVTENNIKRRQLLTESFSGVWSISYKFDNNFTVDYTGNLYGPMRLPLLGPKDDRPEYSPWFSIQNIQLSKKFTNSWEIYGGIKNLLNFTPAANSISRAFDPFDEQVDPNDPDALTFDPSYVYASNQGIRAFLGVRFTLF
ncbi:TonB-dependent receptor [Polaribacter dokdonensis]|uniref:Outer membrane receptor for ferrienterochelin and colicins n=1 Tax=Polaribacter dokdonensis DSW-5 TaxID=1300348 RepID=A0A0M9CFC0_9FLAO|nr:TonB-dependent receptor [Polaribacter dokdonensis]KOY51246.1 TonB dependent/ligand-gated channel [Polaribacter dokdonensis DSW-5]SEE15625.1 outer membrane receptor for ferrienterochelin and colicins [Polaribacter dokdonensis DSW-5]